MTGSIGSILCLRVRKVKMLVCWYAGGTLREWYMIISKEIFNPDYALFMINPGDRVTYMANPSSDCNPNHLCYFKFIGHIIAKAGFVSIKNSSIVTSRVLFINIF